MKLESAKARSGSRSHLVPITLIMIDALSLSTTPGREDAEHLAKAILDVKDKLGLCTICNNISESELCLFCRDPNRDPSVVCVVEEAHNIVGIETTRGSAGGSHVLHGSLSPLRGIGPESLKIKGLVERIGRREIQEVILATNPTVEGEATAVYLSRLLKPLG